MHAVKHAQASVKRYGGSLADYLPVHRWFDASKRGLADARHRALRHHTEGIFWAEEVFGVTITNSEGRLVPVRSLGEDHVYEDLGRIPTLADWLRHIPFEPWMRGRSGRRRGREAADADDATRDGGGSRPLPRGPEGG